jgi:hypothetical protein
MCKVLPDLAGMHVEGGAELDVRGPVAAEIGVHEAGHEVGPARAVVEADALHQ